jgi:hypothetical protein
MILEKKLTSLAKYVNKDAKKFKTGMDKIVKEYNSLEDRKRIVDFINKTTSDDLARIDNLIADANVRLQLAEVSEMVSFAYIAKKYFGKTRQWLNVRINGGIVNGKSAIFTVEDKERLNFALKDIGKKIGSTVIS